MTSIRLWSALATLMVAFFLAGYIGRLFRIWQSRSALPSPPEAILGYAVTALASLFGLTVLGSPLTGVAAVAAVSLVGAFVSHRAHTVRRPRVRTSGAAIVKLVFVATLVVLYTPALVTGSLSHRLPADAHLPTQIGAIVASAHATTWPAPNPYFPDLPFIYNLLFYLPVGLACQLAASSAFVVPAFAVATLWVAWQALGCLETVMRVLGAGSRWRTAGLLLATFLGGLGALFMAPEPAGRILGSANGTDPWIDVPLAVFAFAPHHVFAVACALVTWLFVQSSRRPRRALLGAVAITACGALASFALAPMLLAGFGLASFAAWLPSGRAGLRTGAFHSWRWVVAANLGVIGLCGPFLLSAQRQIVPVTTPAAGVPPGGSWLWFALALGWALPLSLLGTSVLARHSLQGRTFLALLAAAIPAALGWGLLPDSTALMALRLILVVPAALGLSKVWSSIPRQLAPVAPAVLTMLLLFAGLSAVVPLGSLLSASYTRRDPEHRRALETLRSLPFDSTILFASTDEEQAAVTGHLTFMNRAAMHVPAALQDSAEQRLRHFVRDFCPPSSVAAMWDPTTRTLVRAYSVDEETLLARAPERWTPWPSPEAVEVSHDAGVVALASQALADVALTTPITFEPGTHRIAVVLSGEVQGRAHVSLHGDRKLIDIPEGDYSAGQEFATAFQVDPPGFKGQLSFGLGGWAVGAGRLRLVRLELGPFRGCGDER